MIKLLHISDLHYHLPTGTVSKHAFNQQEGSESTRGRSEPTLVNAILEALKEWANTSDRPLPSIDAIIVSGDITYTASNAEFTLAATELGKLRSQLNVAKGKVLLVPGNHDAQWTKDHSVASFENFRTMYKAVRGTTPHQGPGEFVDRLMIETETERLVMFGSNSAQIESYDDQGIGMVGIDCLQSEIDNWEAEQNTDGSAGGTTTKARPTARLLCLHHHLLPVAYIAADYSSAERGAASASPARRTSVTLDAKAALNLCLERDIHLVLHGHQHQPTLACYTWVDVLSTKDDSAASIWLSGAGSAGIRREHLGEAARRHFQVVEIAAASDDGLMCEIHAFESSTDDALRFTRRTSRKVTLDEGAAEPKPIGPTEPHVADHCRPGDVERSSLREVISKLSSPHDRSDLLLCLVRITPPYHAGAAHDFFTGAECEPLLSGKVEALYDLFGEFDMLVKLRTAKPTSESRTALLKALGEKGFLGPRVKTKRQLWSVEPDVIDIRREFYNGGGSSVPQLIRGITAFLRISQLVSAAKCDDTRELIAAVVGESKRAFLSGLYEHDTGLVAEVYLACGGYYELAKAVSSIEDGLRSIHFKAERSTMLAMSTWRPELQS